MDRNIQRLGLAIVLLAIAGVAWAAGPRAVRETIEASMLVTGSIDIEPDGRVSAYRLDRVDELPPEVVTLVEKAAGIWRFEPVLVDGVAAPVHAPMSLRIGARRQGEGKYGVDIRSARFGEDRPGSVPTGLERRPPMYPTEAVYRGIQGTVYLVLRIGPDGTVEDMVAEQVNLRYVAGERAMDRARDLLARVSMSAARSWTFAPPADAPASGNTGWSVRVPVDFTLGRDSGPGYGEWRAYVPGPRHDIPWRKSVDSGFGPDALAAGGVYPLDHAGPRLLTGLNGA
jgi:TonB family protein